MGGGKASPVQGEVSTRSVDGGVVRQCNNPSVSLAADSPLYTRGAFGVLAFTARNTPHSTMTLPLFRSARSSRIMTMASLTGSLVCAPVVMFLQDTMPAAISSSPKNST